MNYAAKKDAKLNASLSGRSRRACATYGIAMALLANTERLVASRKYFTEHQKVEKHIEGIQLILDILATKSRSKLMAQSSILIGRSYAALESGLSLKLSIEQMEKFHNDVDQNISDFRNKLTKM